MFSEKRKTFVPLPQLFEVFGVVYSSFSGCGVSLPVDPRLSLILRLLIHS